MSRKMKMGIIAVVTLLVVLFFWIPKSNNSDASTQKNKQKITFSNWEQEYNFNSQEPRGLYHWNAALKLKIDRKQTISTIDYLYSIDTISRKSNPTFMFIGTHFVLHEEEIDSLLKRVESGAQLFIAASNIDGSLLNRIFSRLEYGYEYDSIVTISGANANYSFVSKYENFTIASKWEGYKNAETKDSLAIAYLSGFGPLSNSMSVSFGAGQIYINTTPQLFTNYQLLTNDGTAYAKTWLNEIPSKESIYWLEMANFTYWEEDFEDTAEIDSSYLQFIFQSKTRVVALIFLAIGILLFVIFRSKRMQPIIPIVPKKRNMTMIFADTITSIYFNHRNPITLVHIQRSNFYSIVLKHFHIDLSKENQEQQILSLAQKSTVSQQEITALVHQLESLKAANTTENELAELRKHILQFYRQSGIISSKVLEKLDQKIHKVYRNEWISGLFIVTGIFLFMYGMYFLTKAIAIGILFWPLGAIPLIMGILRLTKPYLTWTNHTLHVYPMIGKKQKYEMKHLKLATTTDKTAHMQFDTARVEIHFWELNKTDARQFKRFVNNHNKLN